ncbi:cupin domain-containing protein [Streptomyces sp. NPDC002104]
MKAFRLDELEAERAANKGAYLQFLRERNMSVGLYALDAGQSDPQQPHAQDEVYFVVSGRASITVGDETTTVANGSVVYVPAGVPHKFHHITENLKIMVVFSPPEG